tara:strand:- start:710 stop:1264 length:555 start_codon:yes stop_codon:yes gene_type:complete
MQSSIKTKSFPFTSPESARIAAAQAEIKRLIFKLETISNLRIEIREVGEAWAADRIDMLTAAAHLTASSAERDEMARVLRPPLKTAIKATIASVADLAQKAREHHLQELKRTAAELEKSERASQEAAGMAPDDYKPSAAVSSVREQHKACLLRKDELLGRGEILSLNNGSPAQPAAKPKAVAIA